MRTTGTFGVLMSAAALLLLEAPAWGGPITYTAVNIGSLPGTNAFGYAINASGQVTGESYSATIDHAFLYTPGMGMQDLSSLAGSTGTSAGFAINASGQVTGISDTLPGRPGNPSHAFLYTPGSGMIDLGTLPGDPFSEGVGINARGQVTGRSSVDLLGTNSRAFLYTPGGGLTALPLAEPNSIGNGINDSGQVVGSFNGGATVAPTQAYLYTPGSGVVELGTAPSSANAINASGQVAGYSGASSSHAFLYTPGVGLQDLGTLGGPYDAYSSASALNDEGQVTGESYNAAGFGLAFLYTGGTMYDLNSLVMSGLPAGVTLAAAAGINDNGWIIADSENAAGGLNTAYLLEPNVSAPAVPEPRSLALLGLGSALLVGFGWRRRDRAMATREKAETTNSRSKDLMTTRTPLAIHRCQRKSYNSTPRRIFLQRGFCS